MTKTSIRERPVRRSRRQSGSLRVLAFLLAVLVLAVLITESLALGSRELAPAEVWQGLLAHDNSVASKVIWGLRIHRTILAIVVGASLAVAGVVMQALTRNPLAEPGILGVNAGASLAVVTAIGGFGFTAVNQYLPFAFAGAATAAVGPITFIGLVVPHVVRMLIGADQRRLLVWSVVAGAGLLLLADVVGRLLIRPTELEAGIVTAFIGAPVLLVLAITHRTGRGIA